MAEDRAGAGSTPEKNPLVSVIIPVYNGEKYLAETIRSVTRQTYPHWEIIAVNDGSPDGSLRILGREKELLPDRLTIITVENGGVSRARNTAVSRSSGSLIAFVDQDDLWAPDKLEKQVQKLRADPDAALVFSNEAVIDETGAVLQEKVLSLSGACRGEIFSELLFENFIPISSVMMRKDLFLAIGGFSPRYTLAEDFDLLLRAVEHYRAEFVDEPLLLYREHTGSFTSRRIDRLMAESFGILKEWKVRRPELFSRYRMRYWRFLLKFYLLKLKVKLNWR